MEFLSFYLETNLSWQYLYMHDFLKAWVSLPKIICAFVVHFAH